MKLGVVTGAVWASKKCTGLNALALLQVTVDGRGVIAADLVGAGQGERVLVSFGAAARQLCAGAPVDAAIVAIVDETEEGHVGQ